MEATQPCPTPRTTDLLALAAERGIRYRAEVDARPVAPSPEVIERLSALGGPLPNHPSPLSRFSPCSMRLAPPRPSPPPADATSASSPGARCPSQLAASWLAAAWDQNAGLYVMSPVAAELETIALGWLLRYPRPACRDWRRVRHRRDDGQLHRAGRRAPCRPRGASAGMSRRTASLARHPITVVVGAEAHATLYKALGAARAGPQPRRHRPRR